MSYPETSIIIWSLGIVQIAGLISAWLARLSEGSRSQRPCQWLFLTCLGLMGVMTMFSIALGLRYWLACGTTLSVMVLGAIWDFRAEARPQSL